MILVINEWIFEDLNGENSPDKFKEAAEFVVRLNRSQYKVVMPVERRWREKANRARVSANPMHREAGRLFVDLFGIWLEVSSSTPTTFQQLPMARTIGPHPKTSIS